MRTYPFQCCYPNTYSGIYQGLGAYGCHGIKQLLTRNLILDFHSRDLLFLLITICDALRNSVPAKACSFTKNNTPPWIYFTYIVQVVPNRA